MPRTIRADDELKAKLSHLGNVVVFRAGPVSDDWAEVLAELQSAFAASQPAAVDPSPVVYIVSSDALLGRTGAGNAMVATALLSAARTLAIELKKSGEPVNVIGVAPDTSSDELARWVTNLAAGGPTGELVQLGGTQIGKALP